MADPLILLKEYISKGTPIQIEGDEYVFGKSRFNKNVQTAFKNTTGGFYTLHAVHFCYQNRDLPRGSYVIQTTRIGTTAVAVNDKKKLLAFLNGDMTALGEDYIPSTVLVQESSSGASTSGTSAIGGFDRSAHLVHDKREIGEIQELELTGDMIKDRDVLSSRIDNVKTKPTEGAPVENETDFIEYIKNKRKALEMEKSSFLQADEQVTKNIISREKPFDNTSILSTPNSLNDILENYKKYKSDEEEKKRKQQQQQQRSSSISASSSSSSNSNINIPTNLKNRTPIIIVPSSMTSPISIYNAKDFLQNAKYLSSIEKKEEMSAQNLPKPNTLSFERGSQRIAYEIYDNIRLLKPDDWLRVAAVFVQGEAWQFKDWKWNTPVDLLSNVKGYYIKFDDSNTPEVVKQWDVKILTISKSKRHLDQTAQIEFWSTFDQYILQKKPYLNH